MKCWLGAVFAWAEVPCILMSVEEVGQPPHLLKIGNVSKLCSPVIQCRGCLKLLSLT